MELLDAAFERLIAARSAPGRSGAPAAVAGGPNPIVTLLPSPKAGTAAAEADALLGGVLALMLAIAQHAGGARLLMDQVGMQSGALAAVLSQELVGPSVAGLLSVDDDSFYILAERAGVDKGHVCTTLRSLILNKPYNQRSLRRCMLKLSLVHFLLEGGNFFRTVFRHAIPGNRVFDPKLRYPGATAILCV